ncbi:MAG TPA: cytochrome c [Kofleriaceae bacterium]|nr:cytochrome c [Kofleriaceae bacterium]
MRAVVVAAIVGLMACGDPTGGSMDGPTLFAQLCAPCHGPRGQPPGAMVARLGVKDLTSPELRKKLTPMFVENQVHNGSKNKLMPAFDGTSVNDAQIRAVSMWVASPEFLK